MKALLITLFLFVAYSHSSDRVIYGEDNRLDAYDVSDYWQSKALSTVALMRGDKLVSQANSSYKVRGENYGEYYYLCPDEPFREQMSAAFCSGSLVAPDVIMTAGHCIRSKASCGNTKFVFGWGYYSPDEDISSVSALNVYSCDELIVTKENSLNGADFALVKLDRPVIGYDPLPLSRQVVSKGEPLVIIGHPAGIPTKVADGAKVRKIESGYFVANIDALGGNSGSAVFNERTGLIEGILVRGVYDFNYENGCRISNVCADNGCRGEDVTRVDMVLPYLED